jgi:hypothetical protein
MINLFATAPDAASQTTEEAHLSHAHSAATKPSIGPAKHEAQS